MVAERLRDRGDGRIEYAPRRPWRHGTTGFVFDPGEFLERLVALARHLPGHGALLPGQDGGALGPTEALRRMPPGLRARRHRRSAQLRRLVAELPPDEVAFCQDEVDIHLNPRPGPDWTLPGHQHWVRTPGKNQKRYVAGALRARTGRLIWVSSDRKASGLFIALVDKVARRHARVRRIHLIVDNYSIHDSKLTREAVGRHGERVVLHFLPPYCPDQNGHHRDHRPVSGFAEIRGYCH